MTSPALGFIGFGEAAFHIAKGLRGAGVEPIRAYDVNAGTGPVGDRIRRRAEEANVMLAPALRDLIRDSNIIFSTVVASVAEDVAAVAAPLLRPDQVFIDLNSTAPDTKRAVAAKVAPSGAGFVEAAVMAAVPSAGHRVPMLLSGAAAASFAARMAPYGMNLEVLGTEIGEASAIKMCRSIVLKGLEALLLESLLAASRFGAAERVFASVGQSLPGLDWNALAHYFATRSALHGERRAHEMNEVSHMLEGLGIEPIMASAAARRIGWCGALGLASRFSGRDPTGYDEVLRAIAEAVPS